jgi:hypothetical protein
VARSSRRASSAPPPPAPPSFAARLTAYRPSVAAALTALVVVTALFSVDAVRDAISNDQSPDADLVLPIGYVVLGPISSILDTLTLLTVPQHIAFVLLALVGYTAYRVNLWRTRRSTIVRDVLGAVGVVAGIVVTYAAVALLPRPMARLEALRSDVLVADFHMHTQYSHDGRDGWTAEKARAWERASGADVAYITDHRTFEGADDAYTNNPATAGAGTTLLHGIEAIYLGEHVNILGAGKLYRGLLTPDLRDVDETAMAMFSTMQNFEPIVVETIPGNLENVAPAGPSGGMRAIELIDGAPRGLTQTRREREQILTLAARHRMALVSGSDNHGYGRAAAGWTLLRVEGWRTLSADSLSRMIELVIRAAGNEATRVIERRIGETPGAFALFAPVVVPWRMLTTLTIPERVSWIVWIWAVALGLRFVRQRKGGSPAS